MIYANTSRKDESSDDDDSGESDFGEDGEIDDEDGDVMEEIEEDVIAEGSKEFEEKVSSAYMYIIDSTSNLFKTVSNRGKPWSYHKAELCRLSIRTGIFL